MNPNDDFIAKIGFGLAVFTVWIVAFDPANLPIKH